MQVNTFHDMHKKLVQRLRFFGTRSNAAGGIDIVRRDDISPYSTNYVLYSVDLCRLSSLELYSADSQSGTPTK